MTNQLTPYTSYQFSTVGVGVIATGLSDIRQCIDNILRTIPGSDPLRPLFGCDIFQYVDKPVTTAIPNMKKSIFDALSIWEKRISVTVIAHEIKKENVLFNITYKVVDSDMIDMLIWSIDGGLVSGDQTQNGIVLNAIIPTKITNGRYNIALVLNGNGAYPPTPLIGFDTASDMLAWVSANWGSYGSWYLTENKIVLYLNNISVSTASLLVTQTAVLTKTVYIPVLNIGEYYQLGLLVDGVSASPVFPANTIATVEQLLQWLNDNWSNYGSWFIQNNGTVVSAGDFNEDFNNDFSTGGIKPDRYLVFQTKDYTTVILAFS